MSTSSSHNTVQSAESPCHISSRSKFSVCSRKCILFIVFLYIGVSIGIPGCTLIFIERTIGSREDEVALIFSSRAVGYLSGWLFGLLVLDLRNSFNPVNLMVIGVLGLATVYFILMWTVHTWWVMCAFVFQGAFIVFTTQGCLALTQYYRPQSEPHSAQHLIFVCLLGCCLAPFIAFPFLRTSAPPPNPHNLSLFMLQHLPNNSSLLSGSLPNSSRAIRLKRFARAVVSAMGFVPLSLQNQSSDRTSFPVSNLSLLPKMEAAKYYSSTIDLVQNSTVVTLTTPLSTTTNIATTTVSTTSTVPMKPSVIDAKHLNQDSSSADGSQTASRIKQLSEERKIDTLAGVPALPPPIVTPKPPESSSPPVTPFVSKPEVSETSSTLSENSTVSPLSITISLSSNYSEDIVPVTTTLPSVNSTDNLTVSSIASSDSTTTGHMSVDVADTTNSGVISTSETTTPVGSLMSVTPFPAAPTTTANLSSTTHHSRIAEHSSVIRSVYRRSFGTHLMPMQGVYLTLSVFGFFLWFIILSTVRFCCHHPGNSGTTDVNSFGLRPRICSFKTTGYEHDGSELAMEYQGLLEHSRENSTESDDGELYTALDGGSSHYLSACEEVNLNPCEKPPFCSTPVDLCNSITHDAIVSDPVYATHAVHWPKISWPNDSFLLSAEFFNVGLETAYGAFIHGFAVRYLFWSPALAFLAVSLFWLGGLVGRLPDAFLSHSNLPSFRRRLYFTHLMNSQHCTPSSTLSSGCPLTSINWLSFAVRLCGATICILCGAALTHQSFSTDRYDIFATLTSPPQGSHDYYIWLGGSLCLGLGIGLSCSTGGSMIATHHVPTVLRLQLTGILSQMFVPPFIAYIHHRAVFWRYTCVLGISVLILSSLLSSALVADVIQRSIQRSHNSGRNHVHLVRTCPSSRAQISSDPADSASSITLHGVDE